MKRREFLAALAGATFAAPGLEAGRTYHLGTLTPVGPISPDSPNGKILLKALAERGYVLGQNMTLEAYGVMGDITKLSGLLQDMKAHAVDASSSSATLARLQPSRSACRQSRPSASATPSRRG
jgi:putative tryptophan/tyrosine transport system substrate-binding protein